MEERPRYWQQQYDKARPTRPMLWSAAHRRLVRGLFAVLIGAAVAFLVWAAHEGGSIVSPIINVLVFCSQFYFWGVAFPRQVDEWRARQADQQRPQDL